MNLMSDDSVENRAHLHLSLHKPSPCYNKAPNSSILSCSKALSLGPVPSSRRGALPAISRGPGGNLPVLFSSGSIIASSHHSHLSSFTYIMDTIS